MEKMTDDALLVWTTLPDEEGAERMAADLVREGLSACVHVLAGGRSYYLWQGNMEKAQEWTLLIKTRFGLYAAVERRIQQTHPYDLPEILATPVVRGEPGYLRWLIDATGDAPS